MRYLIHSSTGELYHHGIKGQKWGIRRYRNADGSLTAAGKKRYSSMSDDKLQKSISREIRRKRSSEHGWANQWMNTATIGENSRKESDRYWTDYKKYHNSKEYKQFEKKAKELDRLTENGKLDVDEYDKRFEELRRQGYRSDLDNSIRSTGKGREYSKDFLEQYGRDLNVAYIKDLGYDEKTAKEFAERILKSNKKVIGY